MKWPAGGGGRRAREGVGGIEVYYFSVKKSTGPGVQKGRGVQIFKFVVEQIELFFDSLSYYSRQDLDTPEGRTVISNPVAAHDTNNQTNVFCLCDDGQVYYKTQDADKLAEFGKWLPVSSKLPFETGLLFST